MAEENSEAKPAAEVLNDDDLKNVEEVKGRLKFFFSDANVRQDHFIRKLLLQKGGDHPGRVPIEALLRFNTIKKYTTKPAVLAKATKELSDLLTLDEAEVAIGRVNAFTEEMMDDNIPKSLYVQNLPLTEASDDSPKQYAVTVDEIRDAFASYGEVALVKLRWTTSSDGKDDDDISGRRRPKKGRKQPVGAALVEFATKEGLEKASKATLTTEKGESRAAEEKVCIGSDKVELGVMLLSEYVESRKKERGSEGSRKRSRDNAKGGEDEDAREIPEFKVDWKPGCVIKMKGLAEGCDREAILDTIAKGLDVSVVEVKGRRIYADFSRGQTDGAIRFPETDDKIAVLCKSLNDGELEIQGAKVEEARVLEGDEEKKYWEDFMSFKNKQIQQREEEKRAKKKQRRGGRN